MGATVIKARQYICDNPDCDTVRWAHVDDPPLYGWSGTAVNIHETGGTAVVEWWACSMNCIASAVVSAVEREQD